MFKKLDENYLNKIYCFGIWMCIMAFCCIVVSISALTYDHSLIYFLVTLSVFMFSIGWIATEIQLVAEEQNLKECGKIVDLMVLLMRNQINEAINNHQNTCKNKKE